MQLVEIEDILVAHMDLYYNIPDTPTLYSGWKYNLNAVKDIKVTDDFMTLDQKGCGDEAYENCTSRTYVRKVVDKCGCLPFSISFNNSKVTISLKILCLKTFAGQNLLSREYEMCKRNSSF